MALGSKSSRLGKTGFADHGRRKIRVAPLNMDRRSSFVARLIISFLFSRPPRFFSLLSSSGNSRGILELIIEIIPVSEIN